MRAEMISLERRLRRAIATFWTTRVRQKRKQGRSGTRDQGSRGAVTGGGQLDACVDLVAGLLIEAGVPSESIYRRRLADLPGYFRPTKQWDLIVVMGGNLLVSVEFKSQVGSFGNNCNNRSEEAIGNATDLWTAYREGAFSPSPRPWIGYFMVLEDAKGSSDPVRVVEPHFPTFEVFRNTSYAQRYEILCRRLVRERLYDAACLILTKRQQGARGEYREAAEDVGFSCFVRSLTAHVRGYLSTPP
jgi:hypothetical protein